VTKETYIRMMEALRKNTKLAKTITYTNKFITYLVFLMYPVLLLYLLITKSEWLFRAIVVPLDTFIILSVFRYLVNRPRPYEKFNTAPIINKDTKGKSFPSRHVFSAFVIAMTFYFTLPYLWVAVVLLVMSLAMAVIRVVSGVHFISDVLVGALVGIVGAIIGFAIINHFTN